MCLFGVVFFLRMSLFGVVPSSINYVGAFIMWRKTVQTYNAKIKIKLATDILRKTNYLFILQKIQILFLFLRGEEKIQIVENEFLFKLIKII